MKILRGDCQCELSYHECSHNWYDDWYRCLAWCLVLPECAREGPVQRLALGLLFRCQVAPSLVILGLQLPWFLVKPNGIQIPSLLALVGLWRRHFLFRDSLLTGINFTILLQRATLQKLPALLPPVCRCVISDAACNNMARCRYDFLYCAHE